MSEYITKEELRGLLKPFKTPISGVPVMAVSEYAINAIPAADVEPVVRGEWKEFDADMNAYSCSVCNEPQMFIEGNPEQNKYSFCPNCGAHMERSGSGE